MNGSVRKVRLEKVVRENIKTERTQVGATTLSSEEHLGLKVIQLCTWD